MRPLTESCLSKLPLHYVVITKLAVIFFVSLLAGTHLCMNSPMDPALLQLVQQELKSLQDDVKNMSTELEDEKRKVQDELKNAARTLEEVEKKVQRLEMGQQTLEHRLEHRSGLFEDRMDTFEGGIY